MNTEVQDPIAKRQWAFSWLRDKANISRGGHSPNVYQDSTAIGLTTCIIDCLRYEGHHAERVHPTFYPISVGNGLYKKGRCLMEKGTPDVHGCLIGGKAIYIEVKVGKDRLSSYQKAFRNKILSIGGLIYTAYNFPDMLEWYMNNIKYVK